MGVTPVLFVLLTFSVRERGRVLDHTTAVGGVLPNHNPLFERGPDLRVLEDSGVYGPQVWATGIVDGDGPLVAGRLTDSGRQSVEFRFIFTDVTLFDGVQGRPKMADDGLLTFKPAPDNCGVATVRVELLDSGTPNCVPGTSLSGRTFVCPGACVPTDCHVSTQAEFFIEVVCVNDPPSFQNLGNHAAAESSGEQIITGWAYNVEKGANLGGVTVTNFELQQFLTFTVTQNSNPSLFSAQPRVVWDTSTPSVADLRYTPAPGVCGTATVTVSLMDSGGTTNGGLNTAQPATFVITVTCKNDIPSFVCGPGVRINEDHGGFQSPNWAQAISTGDGAASGQRLYFDLFFVDDAQQQLFSVLPAVDPVSGTLSFTAKQDANTFNKAVDVRIRLRDDAGAVSCEPLDTCCTLRITIDPVNDPPSFTCGSSITVCEDLMNLPVAPTPPIYTDGNKWATLLNIGAENEGIGLGGEGQQFVFTLTPDKQDLFVAGPSIDEYGTLTFELAPDANGDTSVSVVLRDTGSNIPPSQNQAATCEFIITVLPVSDAPAFEIPGPNPLQTTEDALLAETTFPSFVTRVSRGPPDEAGQFASFSITTTNPAMFKTSPTIELDSATSGTLSFELNENTCGQTDLSIVLRDNGDPSTCGQRGMNSFQTTHTLKVECVNDPPTFNLSCEASGCNIVVCEDEFSTGMEPYSTSGFIQNLYAGPMGKLDEDAQSVTFRVTTSNDRLFSSLPAITPAGTLSFVTEPDTYGTATVTVQGIDDGVPQQTITKQFLITIEPANDPPSFEVTGDLLGTRVQECHAEYGPQCTTPTSAPSCARVFPAFAYDIRPSSTANLMETNQVVSFEVLVDQAAANELFSVLPTVDPKTGTLSFTTKVGASTTQAVALQIVATDSLETDRQCGGVGRTTKTVMLSIAPVNWKPCFTCGPDVVVKEDEGQVVVAQHATNITAGPYEDITQQKTFTLVPSKTELFLEGPRIDPSSGSLYFVTNPDYCGETDVLVHLDDGEALQSRSTCSFHISVTPVNDAPSFRHSDAVTLNEDRGRYCQQWIHDSSPGNLEGRPGGQCEQQSISFFLEVVENQDMFLELPTLDAGTGDLCFRVKDDVCGTATFEAWVTDDGGVANGGIDRSARVRSQIVVSCINDAPSFTPGGDVTVCEDQNAHIVYKWCSAETTGPLNEQAQTLSFNVANNNPDLFLVPPYIVDCSLFFTPAHNAFGTAKVTVDLCDDGEKSLPHVNCATRVNVNINVLPVNDAPSFISGGDITVLEDSGPHVIPTWARGISKGGNPSGIGSEREQELQFVVTVDTPSLFSRAPEIETTGDLTFALTEHATGQSIVTACVKDTGGTGAPPSALAPVSCPNGVDTSCTTFVVRVTQCNDPPSFTGAAAIEVSEDAGRTTIASWITSLNAGPGETTQSFIKAAITVPVDKRYLFSELPIVSSVTGDLTFTTAPNVWGAVVGTLEIRDDGGTIGANCFDVVRHTFTITILPVNDFPSFVAGGDVSVPEDSQQYRSAWASMITAGPFEDDTQVVSFIVSNSNPMIFIGQPTLDSNGVLTFTPRPDMHGASTVSVQLYDGGGDFSTTEAVTFTIIVRPVNDPAMFVKGPDVTVKEGAGSWCNKAWASMISSGNQEPAMTLTFTVTPRCCPTFFTSTPTVDPVTGDLCFSLAENVFGVVTLDVILADNGVNTDQGNGQSAPQSFMLTITPVNDPPFFVPSSTIQILEDSGPQVVTNHMKLINAGPFEDDQVLTFTLASDPVGLFASQPAASAITGDVSFTAAPNANGEATVNAVIRDNGGTADGGQDTYTDQFAIRIVAVNDAPSFVSGADIEAHEDAGRVVITSWASSLLPGPPDELVQTLTFFLTPVSMQLFASLPTLAVPSGDLTLDFKPDANGVVDITVTLKDDGGVENGGSDTSVSAVFRVQVNAMNDAPTYAEGPPAVAVVMNSNSYSGQWATNIKGGPIDEDQKVTFRVTVTQPSLFEVQPAVNAAGVLTFTPATGAKGETTAVVIAEDSDGATSVPRSIRIVVSPSPPTLIRAVLNQEFSSFSYAKFKTTVAEALQVPETRVLVTGIEPGSVVVDFMFAEKEDTATSSPSSKTLTDSFLAMVKNGAFRTELALLEAYPRTNVSQPPNSASSGGLDDAYVAVIVVVVVVTLCAAAGVAFACYRRKASKDARMENEASSAAASIQASGNLPVMKSCPLPDTLPDVQENPLQGVFTYPSTSARTQTTIMNQSSQYPYPNEEAESEYTDSVIIYPESPEVRGASLG